MFHIESLSAGLLLSCVSSTGVRSLSTTVHVCGRKSRDPYDRRFGIHLHDALPGKPGATKELYEELSRAPHLPQKPGYYTRDGDFVFVKEMIPEFVVPDLTDFKLKPYVSYKVSDVTKSKFTARHLFNSTYAKIITDDFNSGKLEPDKVTETIKTFKSSDST